MPELTHHARAFGSRLAYDRHIATGLRTAYDHLIAGSLASDNADAEYSRAAQSADPGETRMFLRFGDEAREDRDAHERAAHEAAKREGTR